MATLEQAIVIAAKAHTGQVDKAGAPYILHPLRVMLSLDSPEDKIVGVLHDVVEDSPTTFEDLRAAGFSETTIQALASVTRRPDEAYLTFVARAAADPIGRRVKLADLRDNTDRSRIPNPSAKDYARLERYRQAIRLLEETAPNAER